MAQSAVAELPSVFFCDLCDTPFGSVAAVRTHVTRSNDGPHEERRGHDPDVVIDAVGRPVEPPTRSQDDSPPSSFGISPTARETERRAALAGYIEDRGGSPHVVDHVEQAKRFGVSPGVISEDLRHLRETGEIAGSEPTERTPDGEPVFRCGFCHEPFESVRAVKTHVSKKSDDVHRGHVGSDPRAIQRPERENP